MSSGNGWLRPYTSTFSVVFRLCDTALIFVSHFAASLVMRREFGATELAASAMAALAFQTIGERRGLYLGFRGHPLRNELLQVVSTWSMVIPVLLFAAFAMKSSAALSRLATIGWFLAAPVTLGLFRIALRSALAELRHHGRNSRTTAIVGMTPLGERLAEQIARSPWLGMRLVGFFDDRSEDRRHRIVTDGPGFVGDLDDLITRAHDGEIDFVYLALPLRAEIRLQRIVEKLADTTATVHMAADFEAFDLLQARWSTIGEIPVVSIHETPFHGIDGWLKRLEDLVIGACIMAAIALPMLAVAIAVKLSSKGPVFFRQRRYGLNGEVIYVLKFRTMTVSEDGDAVKQATKNDQRITPVGAFLRRTSLDELPQFLQVLTGEMSIVGPRPHAVVHNELYRQQIRGYMLRHKVKPGITGWAQVNGLRGETVSLDQMKARVEYDLEYLRNWSIGLDLQIIARTVKLVFADRNAF